MLIAPTEPPRLRAIGTTSLVPERFGVDILLPTRIGAVGIQRKEITDLIASVQDGRVQRELIQQKPLVRAVWLIEGRLQWTSDGNLLAHSSWSRSQFYGVVWSIQSRGYWVGFSDDLSGTIEYVGLLDGWLAKDRHNSLLTRPGPATVWGKANDRDWGIHLLQSFAGIGPDLAGRIFDTFGGVPLQWTVNMQRLMEVQGVGRKKAESMMTALIHDIASQVESVGQEGMSPPEKSPPSPSSSRTEKKSRGSSVPPPIFGGAEIIDLTTRRATS